MNTDIHSYTLNEKPLIGFWTPGKIVLSTYPFTKKFSLTFKILFISKDDGISVKLSFCGN